MVNGQNDDFIYQNAPHCSAWYRAVVQGVVIASLSPAGRSFRPLLLFDVSPKHGQDAIAPAPKNRLVPVIFLAVLRVLLPHSRKLGKLPEPKLTYVFY